jgi:Ohr subfamily peroxiredoxin
MTAEVTERIAPAEVTEVSYTTSATSKGGRTGNVKSADGVVNFDLSAPGQFSDAKANPETLFAAGFAACFAGALTFLGTKQSIDTSESLVTANVSFGKTGDTGFGLAVEIVAELPGVDAEAAAALVEQAHQFCPYSKAVLGNIVATARVA